jgi:hypothetical protein
VALQPASAAASGSSHDHPTFASLLRIITSFGTGVRWLWVRLSKVKHISRAHLRRLPEALFIIHHVANRQAWAGITSASVSILTSSIPFACLYLQTVRGIVGQSQDGFCLLNCRTLVALIFTYLPLTYLDSVWYGARHICFTYHL